MKVERAESFGPLGTMSRTCTFVCSVHKLTCDEFRLNAHAATLPWNSVLHTLTIPYDDATTLPFMRTDRNPVKQPKQ
jgi:hypothetical protein